MRYLILGAGALGGFFGGMLIKGGADVTFLVRPKRATQLQRDGLVVKLQDGSELRTRAVTVQQGNLNGTYDVILLTCKAYDLDGAMDAIAPAMDEQSVILPVLNGVRHVDVLTARFGAESVLGGLTTINAALLPDAQQSQLRINLNAIGELDGRTSTRCAVIKTALEAGGIPVQISDAIVAMMWAKFFGFVISATIASLTRSRAGAIAGSASGPSFVSAVIDECTRVATAVGYPPAPPPAPDTASIMRGMFSQRGSTYGPSILIDMEDGRPTEGEHTIGDLAERAVKIGIRAPILMAARCNLQTYEINRSNSK